MNRTHALWLARRLSRSRPILRLAGVIVGVAAVVVIMRWGRTTLPVTQSGALTAEMRASRSDSESARADGARAAAEIGQDSALLQCCRSELSRRAHELYRTGAWAESRALFDAAADAPRVDAVDAADALRMSGQVSMLLGDAEAASRAFERFLRVHDADPEARTGTSRQLDLVVNLYGTILGTQGRWEEQVRLQARVLESDRSCFSPNIVWSAYCETARAFDSMGRTSEAFEALDRLLDHWPRGGPSAEQALSVREMRAKMLTKLGRHRDGATELYAAFYEPDASEQARLRIGELLFRELRSMGESDEAYAVAADVLARGEVLLSDRGLDPASASASRAVVFSIVSNLTGAVDAGRPDLALRAAEAYASLAVTSDERTNAVRTREAVEQAIATRQQWSALSNQQDSSNAAASDKH